jgi:alpha-tubulin suppressor-like RCC1 family protein
VITQAGALYCWGRNPGGEAGLGPDVVQARAPTRVGEADDWVSIAASQHHTCGVRADGSLWCFGSNGHNELGVVAVLDDSPVVQEPAQAGSELDWKSVAVGWFHTCALKRDDRLFCWGRAIEGQLGVRSVDPLPAPNLITSPARFTRIALGHFHSCGVDDAGTLHCWGMNEDGQLGVGDLERRHMPVAVP